MPIFMLFCCLKSVILTVQDNLFIKLNYHVMGRFYLNQVFLSCQEKSI